MKKKFSQRFWTTQRDAQRERWEMYDDDAKPELRMLSGTGAEDYFNLIQLLDVLAVEVFAKSQTLFKTSMLVSSTSSL